MKITFKGNGVIHTDNDDIRNYNDVAAVVELVCLHSNFSGIGRGLSVSLISIQTFFEETENTFEIFKG